jgi:hypothetical protein
MCLWGCVNIPGCSPVDKDRLGRVQSRKGDVHACLGFDGEVAVQYNQITHGDSVQRGERDAAIVHCQ